MVAGEEVVSVTDVESFELAAILASSIARRLEELMPFDVEGVDLLTAYRSSEDGGLYTRHEVRVYVRRKEAVSLVIEEVRKVLEELRRAI